MQLSINNNALFEGADDADARIGPVVRYCKAQSEAWAALQQECSQLPGLMNGVQSLRDQIGKLFHQCEQLESLLSVHLENQAMYQLDVWKRTTAAQTEKYRAGKKKDLETLEVELVRRKALYIREREEEERKKRGTPS